MADVADVADVAIMENPGLDKAKVTDLVPKSTIGVSLSA